MKTLVSKQIPISATAKHEKKTGTKRTEQQIREQMRLVINSAVHEMRVGERRQEQREAYPYPVYLTPLDRAGGILHDETVVVLGKHVSELGFDFYHREPLPYRRVIVSFETRPNHWTGMMLDLTWCRFGRHGWYDNGGRFLSAVASPLADASMPSLLEN